MQDLELKIKQYNKSLVISLVIFFLSAALPIAGYIINDIKGMLSVGIWSIIGALFGLVGMVLTHKKLAGMLKKYNIISMNPVFYGLLSIIAVFSIPLIGLAVYLIIVNSHIKKLIEIQKVN